MKTIIEPHRIKMVETIKLTTPEQRSEMIRAAHYNLFLLRAVENDHHWAYGFINRTHMNRGLCTSPSIEANFIGFASFEADVVLAQLHTPVGVS